MSRRDQSPERGCDRPSLSLDERVVWISDDGPEYGNIRWLGKLHDLGPEWMAGVEFDNPVGSGTGLYQDRQLFETRLNHASLVPIIGLLKASDFDAPPQHTARKDRESPNMIDFEQDFHANRTSNNHLDSNLYNRGADNRNLIYQAERPLVEKLIDLPRAQMDTTPFQTSYANHSSRIRNIPIELEGGRTKSSNVYHTIQDNRDVQTSRQSYSTTASMHKQQNSNNNIDKLLNTNRANEYLQHEFDPLMKRLSELELERADRATRRKIKSKDVILPEPAWRVQSTGVNPNIALKDMLGKSRGIQGHNNSCYMDATLFAMFSSTLLFDSLLYRPATPNDIPEYGEVQRIIRDEIVRPLREEHFVSAEQVMQFRTMLERSSTVGGLTDQEKDPEEFLSLLLGHILKAEPYLKLSSNLESFLYQLIVDKNENVVLPTVQDLFEQSFMSSTVRLREIPPCLLLQMPRFGRQYKMYSRIMPSLTLDITDVLESAPRACGHRGKDCNNLAAYECVDCYGERSSGGHHTKLSNITYCANCFRAKHFGKTHSTGIESHDKTKKPLDKTPRDALARYSNRHQTVADSRSGRDREIPRVKMELFAVLCIETSHYVCFVKCGQSPEAPWCFFDSMADRRGELHGYNIPEVLLFDEFQFWTSDKGASYLLQHRDDKLLPDMARRLICDAYLCFYQYTGLSAYR